MKKIVAFSLIIAAFSFSASAQEKKESKNLSRAQMENRGKGGKHVGEIEGLSESQKTQMKAIREEYKAKHEALKNSNLSDDQKKERMKALHMERKEKIQKILTPEQRTKMAEARKNHKYGDRKGKENVAVDRQSMKESLGLSDDQQKRLQAHRQTMKNQREAIRNDKSLSDEARKQKMNDLKEFSKAEQRKILTAEQLEKMKEMRAKKGKHSKMK